MNNSRIVQDIVYTMSSSYAKNLRPGETTYIKSLFSAGVDIIAMLVILLILIFAHSLRKSRHIEEKMFRRLCFATILLAAVNAFINIPVSNADVFDMYSRYNIKFMIMPSVITDIAYLFCCLQWRIFVDAMVNRSYFRIRRNYLSAILPFILLMILEAIFQHLYSTGDPGRALLVKILYYLIYLAVLAVYVLQVCLNVRYHKREKKRTLFLRVDVFIIPFLLGLMLHGISYARGVYVATGVVLTLFFMRKRFRYLDLETDFYNEEYLSFMEEKIDAKEDFGGCVISVKGAQLSETARLLADVSPYKSIIFRMRDNTLMMFSILNNRSAADLFSKMIKEEAINRNPENPVDTETWFQKKNELPSAFLLRIEAEHSAHLTGKDYIHKRMGM
ncbi:MAG: hypothetical protein K6G03_09145 [Lachnospiraceae bacterium]|nr:hypothetical protein [Lachnospiraceae bacterium]